MSPTKCSPWARIAFTSLFQRRSTFANPHSSLPRVPHNGAAVNVQCRQRRVQCSAGMTRATHEDCCTPRTPLYHVSERRPIRKRQHRRAPGRPRHPLNGKTLQGALYPWNAQYLISECASLLLCCSLCRFRCLSFLVGIQTEMKLKNQARLRAEEDKIRGSRSVEL